MYVLIFYYTLIINVIIQKNKSKNTLIVKFATVKLHDSIIMFIS
jgi:hypothetical protein